MGRDEKCPTGTFTPTTAEEAAALASANAGTEGPVDYPALVTEAMQRQVALPAEQSQDHKQVLSGVAELAGPVAETQGQYGSTLEATAWNFRRMEDDLRKNRGTWVEKKTTTTKDSAGNVTSTSTLTMDPNPTDEDTKAEDTSGCKEGSEAAGCVKLGEVEDVDLPGQSKAVTVAPMAGWGGSGSCPAPQQLAFSFGAMEFDNTLFCRWLDALRYVLIAVAGIIAARIFIGGVQS